MKSNKAESISRRDFLKLSQVGIAGGVLSSLRPKHAADSQIIFSIGINYDPFEVDFNNYIVTMISGWDVFVDGTDPRYPAVDVPVGVLHPGRSLQLPVTLRTVNFRDKMNTFSVFFTTACPALVNVTAYADVPSDPAQIFYHLNLFNQAPGHLFNTVMDGNIINVINYQTNNGGTVDANVRKSFAVRWDERTTLIPCIYASLNWPLITDPPALQLLDKDYLPSTSLTK